MKAVIDSDIIIDFLRHQEKAKHFIEKIINTDNTIYISALTEAEVLSGKDCNDDEKKGKTEDLLASFELLEVTQSLARKAAELRRKYDVPLHDAIIAATALELAVPIYSRNSKDFKRIKELKLEYPY